MEAMDLKSMDLDKFGQFNYGDGAKKIKPWNFDGFGINLKEFLMKICKKINFGRSLFFAVLTFEGYFGNYKISVHFLEKAISGKIVTDFQSFKKSSKSPKTDFVWPFKRSQEIVVQKSYFD